MYIYIYTYEHLKISGFSSKKFQPFTSRSLKETSKEHTNCCAIGELPNLGADKFGTVGGSEIR